MAEGAAMPACGVDALLACREPCGEAQLAFKRKSDPRGLLNPGKMIAWDNPAHDYSASRAYMFPGLQSRPE